MRAGLGNALRTEVNAVIPDLPRRPRAAVRVAQRSSSSTAVEHIAARLQSPAICGGAQRVVGALLWDARSPRRQFGVRIGIRAQRRSARRLWLGVEARSVAVTTTDGTGEFRSLGEKAVASAKRVWTFGRRPLEGGGNSDHADSTWRPAARPADPVCRRCHRPPICGGSIGRSVFVTGTKLRRGCRRRSRGGRCGRPPRCCSRAARR